jgi:hypothetical protein
MNVIICLGKNKHYYYSVRWIIHLFCCVLVKRGLAAGKIKRVAKKPKLMDSECSQFEIVYFVSLV